MNYKNLSYKQKNILVIAGGLLFLFFAYHFAIKKTLDLVSLHNEMLSDYATAQTAPKEIRRYEEELMVMASILGNFSNEDLSNREMVLALITEFCQAHRLGLNSFPQELTHQTEDYNITTTAIVVEGRYTALVKLLYKLEYLEQVGRVASVEFKMHKDRKTRRNYLAATIYLQNISS